MPPKKTKCGICGVNESRYTCPADKTPYCSLACFKQHKEVSCFATTSTQLAPTPQPPTPLPPPAKYEPLKRLQDLHWPPEPDQSAFSDPLSKHDPKPLNHSQLETLARSPELRKSLETPGLTDVLAQIAELPSTWAQEKALRQVLGLAETDGVPRGTEYRPENDKGKRVYQGYHSGIDLGRECKKEDLVTFADTVKQILASTRT